MNGIQIPEEEEKKRNLTKKDSLVLFFITIPKIIKVWILLVDNRDRERQGGLWIIPWRQRSDGERKRGVLVSEN